MCQGAGEDSPQRTPFDRPFDELRTGSGQTESAERRRYGEEGELAEAGFPGFGDYRDWEGLEQL